MERNVTATEPTFSIAFRRTLLMSLSFIAAVLNLICILVFVNQRRRTKMKTPATLGLLILCWLECLLNLMGFLKESLLLTLHLVGLPKENDDATRNLVKVLGVLLFVIFTFVSVFLVLRNWWIMVLSCCRCYVIVFPLLAKRYIRRSLFWRALAVCVLVAITCTVFRLLLETIPNFFKVEIFHNLQSYKTHAISAIINFANNTSSKIDSRTVTPFQLHNDHHEGVHRLVFSLQSGVPPAVVLIVTLISLRTLCSPNSATEFRRDTRNNSFSMSTLAQGTHNNNNSNTASPLINDRQNSTRHHGGRGVSRTASKIILVIALVFFITQTPSLVLAAVFANAKAPPYLTIICNSLVKIDSSSNFVTFYVIQSQFRYDLRRVFTTKSRENV